MKTHSSTTLTIERDGLEITVFVSGTIYQGNPLDNSDPSEVDNLTAANERGDIFELTEEEAEQAESKLLEGEE